jgi:hypothetical protein
MDRGETHLRLVAEAELRRAREQDASVPVGARVMRVAQALTAVRAIDAASADAIQDDFELALTGRQRKPPAGWRADAPWVPTAWGWMPRRSSQPASSQPMVTSSVKTRPSAQPGGSDRLIPVGLTIPIQSAHSHGELHLLTYAQTAAGSWFTTMAGLQSRAIPAGSGSPPPDLPGMELLNRLAATDETGRAYLLNFRGGAAGEGNGSAEWSGQLRLQPDPRPGLRWLDLATGPAGPATRIYLDPSPPPEVTITPTAQSPGEHLLNGFAASLLGSGRTRIGPGLFTHAADQLGDIIEALQVVGALPPLSPVPGQLATLYARMNVPGVTAAPSGDLPERWLSVLEQERGNPRLEPGQSCAGAAVALPELDGTKILILGLHSSENGTVLHLQASAVEPQADLPVLWLRDDGGHWHTTRPSGFGARDGEVTMRLRIVPPLHRGAWIEVVAAGTSAEARTTLALRWSLAAPGAQGDVGGPAQPLA